MKYIDCIDCGKKSTWVTFWGNLGLMLFKGFVGLVGHSHALVADAIHSAVDVVIAIVTVIAIKISGKAPDKEHPYGHGKIEFIAASVVTAGLLVAVVFLFKAALNELRYGMNVHPRWITLLAAIASIIGSELMFRYNLCASKELNSPAIKANAWHNRYDVYTSLVVAVGIVGAKLGFRILDPIAAFCVGIVIIKIGLDIFMDAYKGLMDVNISAKDREKIAVLASKVKGVENVVSIKSRQMGQDLWIDLVIQVLSKTKIEKVDNIVEEIKESLILKDNKIGNVQVAVKPKN